MTKGSPLHLPQPNPAESGASSAPPAAKVERIAFTLRLPPPAQAPQPRNTVLSHGRLTAWLALAVALAALSYAANLFVDEPLPPDLLFRYSTGISTVIQWAVLLIPLFFITRGLRIRDVLALHRPNAWPWALGLALTVVVADFIAVYLYEWTLGPFEEGALTELWDPSRASQFALNFVVIAVVAPIFEEVMYRGIGYGLLEPLGPGTAIVATGALFGLLHGYVYVLPIYVVYGVTLGWLRARTGSIYPGMLAHGATNATALVLTVTLA
jgi:membrane protease YdiL (CAAX protease family)